MMLMMPLVSLWIGFALPGALGLYWIAGSVFQTIQDFVLGKIYAKQLDAEDAERRARIKAREEEIERKRLETMKLREEGATTINPNTSKRKLLKTEKLKAEQRSAEWQAVHKPSGENKEKQNPSQVGDRPFARGRAYNPNRF
jgi:YidC/Oxa1 family membrane protein insertase